MTFRFRILFSRGYSSFAERNAPCVSTFAAVRRRPRLIARWQRSSDGFLESRWDHPPPD